MIDAIFAGTIAKSDLIASALIKVDETIFGLSSYDEKSKSWVHPYKQATWILIKYIC